MKKLIIFATVLSAGRMQGNTPSIEVINVEVSKKGVMMQEALALCHKKCELLRAKADECEAAKIFADETVANCHAQCQNRADYKIKGFRECVFEYVYKIAEEECENAHK